MNLDDFADLFRATPDSIYSRPVGNGTITVGDYGSFWGYVIEIPGHDPHVAGDLRQPEMRVHGVRYDAQAGFEALCSFLGAAAESYGHTMRTGCEGEHSDLFPAHVVEWAYHNDSEIWIAGEEAEQRESTSAR